MGDDTTKPTGPDAFGAGPVDYYVAEDNGPLAGLDRGLSYDALMGIDGVQSVGIGLNDDGEQAVIVGIRDADTARALPDRVDGISVIFKIIGEVNALPE